MMRVVRRATAAGAVLGTTVALVACTSSQHSGDTSPSAATYHCPTATRATAALGTPVESVRRSPFQDRTVTCDYRTTTQLTVIVGITFDAGAADLTAAIGMIPGISAKTELPGVGDGAYLLRGSADDPPQLFARFGDRLVSVTGDVRTSRSQLVAIARLAGR